MGDNSDFEEFPAYACYAETTNFKTVLNGTACDPSRGTAEIVCIIVKAFDGINECRSGNNFLATQPINQHSFGIGCEKIYVLNFLLWGVITLVASAGIILVWEASIMLRKIVGAGLVIASSCLCSGLLYSGKAEALLGLFPASILLITGARLYLRGNINEKIECILPPRTSHEERLMLITLFLAGLLMSGGFLFSRR